jgi:hypothetical protein
VTNARRTAACAAIAVLAVSAAAYARTSPLGQGAAVVYVAPIEGMIDLGLAPFVERVLREAQEAHRRRDRRGPPLHHRLAPLVLHSSGPAMPSE